MSIAETHELLDACSHRTLNPWESEFVTSVRSRRRPPSDKQLTILRRIAAGGPNYKLLNEAAIRSLPEIVQRWLPGGKFRGSEYFVLNPKRADKTVGSFSVNILTGEWHDFANKADRGKDVVSLAAWLFNLPQPKAAENVAAMLGLSVNEGSRHG